MLYFHAKNVTLKGPYNTKWRWLMNYLCLAQWRTRVEELKDHDAVGLCCKHDSTWKWIFAGNFWWARSSWLRRLPPIRHGRDRFDYERWVLSRDWFKAKSLCGEGGEPHHDAYYTERNFPQDDYLRWLVDGKTS